MFAVDTNIFIYAHFDGYPQHRAARALCETRLLNGADWCLGWQVIYEYARIVTHPRIHTRPLTLEQAIADLDPYLSAPGCQLLTHTPGHRAVLESVTEEAAGMTGNRVHDCHYAALLREHGIKTICTADHDFRRFSFLTVWDPTVAGGEAEPG